MAVITTIGWRGDATDHDAQGLRALAAVLGGAPVQTFTGGISPTDHGGAHGVARGLSVSEKSGTPDMSVDVAAGGALVTGTSSLAQGVYPFVNDATVNLAVTAADPADDRHDLIVAQIRDNDEDGGGSDTPRLFVVEGTAAASPADPSPPAGSLVLARVVVPAAATSITDSDIADLRTYSAGLMGVQRVTSTTRPTVVDDGQIIYETDTDQHWNRVAGVWVPQGAGSAFAAFTTTDDIGGTSYSNWDAFETVTTDPRSWKTSVTRCTPDIAGWYRVTVTATDYSDGSDPVRLRVRKNGASVMQPAAAEGGAFLAVVVSLNGSSDYIEVQQRNNQAFTSAGVGNTLVEYIGPA